METAGMELEIIINPKTTDDGQAIVQVPNIPPTPVPLLSVFSS